MVRLARGGMVLLVSLMWGVLAEATRAQEVPQTAPAVLSFDLNFEKLGELRPLKQLVDDSPQMAGPDGDVIKNALQISGMLSAPTDMQSVLTMQPADPLPFDFFLRLRFADEASANHLLEQTKDEREEVTENGKTWFKPTADAGAPPNLRIWMVDKKTIEFGTVGFLKQPREKILSTGLQELWTGMPNHAVRIAADFETAKEFVTAALNIAKEQTPPEARAFLAPIDKIARLQLSIDGGSEQLLALAITGVDEAGASDIHDGVEALLGLLRMGAGAQVEEMKTTAPEMATVASEILESLNSQLSGKTIKLVVPRPMGFESAIQEALQSVRGAAEDMREMNDLKQIALSIHNYHDAYNKIPLASQQGLSWRVAVLPFMEQVDMFEQFEPSEAWDSKTNQAAAEQMPEFFGAGREGHTQVCFVVPPKKIQRFSEITDGMSNTIMVVRAPTEIPWSKPQDLTVDEVVKIVQGLPEGGSLLVGLYDGSVRRIKKSVNPESLRNMLDPADGNPIDLSDWE